MENTTLLRRIYASVPTEMKMPLLKIFLTMFAISLLVNLYYVLKIHFMKKHGEEAWICKKCKEIFLPRHNTEDEPPSRCTRNHGSENFKPVFSCVLPRKLEYEEVEEKES